MATKPKRRVAGADDQAQKPVKVRGVMEQMRRRQRWLLVILTVLLLVPFGAYGVAQQLLGPGRGRVKGTAYGKRVREDAFNAIHRRMEIVANLVRQQIGGDFVPPISEDQVWDRFILLHEAQRMGLEAAPAEIDSLLALLFPGDQGQFNQSAFETYLAQHPAAPEAEMRQAVGDDLLVGGPLTDLRMLFMQFQQRQFMLPGERLRLGPKLRRHLLATIEVSDDEVWTDFLMARRTYEVASVSVPAAPYVAEVPDPTEDEIAKWYKEYELVTPEESDIGVGYTLPERCELRYFKAGLDDFKTRVTVTDDDLLDYYEANKERFRVTEATAPIPTTGPTTRPATQPTTEPSTQPAPATRSAGAGDVEPDLGPASATQPDTAPIAALATQPDTGPTTTQAVEYRPFEAVKAELRTELIEQKARESVQKAVTEIGNARVSTLEPTEGETVPDAAYEALAQRYHMTYHKPEGLLTAAQAAALADLKDARDPTLGNRTVDQVFFGEPSYEYGDLYDLAGNGLHVWCPARLKAHVLVLNDARADVERDWKAYQAYLRAGTRAGQLLKDLMALPPGTAAPMDALAEKYPGLTVSTSRAFSLGAAANAPTRAAPDATDEAKEQVRLGVFARAIRSDDLPPGGAAVAGDPIGRVQYLVRVTKRTDPDLSEFQTARFSFGLMALEQKRQRFYQEWFREVKAEAKITKEQTKEGQEPGPETPPGDDDGGY